MAGRCKPTEMNQPPDCFKCMFWAHAPPFADMIRCGKQGAEVAAHPAGVSFGRFNYPETFDPLYLLECDSFMPSLPPPVDNPTPWYYA